MSDPKPDLGTFEGHPVLSTAIELPSLAGGLRQAVDVNGGAPIHKGETGYVLVKFEGAKTRFDPVANTDGYQRVDVPKVESVALVEGEAVEKLMADHVAAVAARVAEEQRKKDEEAGTQRIPGTAPYPEDGDDGSTIGGGGDPADADGDGEPWPDDPDHVPGPSDPPEQA